MEANMGCNCRDENSKFEQKDLQDLQPSFKIQNTLFLVIFGTKEKTC